MKKVLCFGAGNVGRVLYKDISADNEIVAFIDNDVDKWGNNIDGVPILSPEDALTKYAGKYDQIFVTSAMARDVIVNQLLQMGISPTKINVDLVALPVTARRKFLENFSQLDSRFSYNAACAEAGVFEGEFAKYINEFFPNRILHLFDTFEGFDARDVAQDKNFSDVKVGEFNQTSEDIVIGKMKYPGNVIIHKGYFPQTAEGVDDNFCFVNLDMDLFKPTYEGLKFFSTRMEHGGVILVHDFFTTRYHGVTKAVNEFMNETKLNLNCYPIGDGMSIMIAGF